MAASNHDLLNLKIHVWRQPDRRTPGKMVTYPVTGVSVHASFLEMLDILNEQLVAKGEEPVAFDHDCREGICGMCSLMINGRPHGGRPATTTCQLHMRFFRDWYEQPGSETKRYESGDLFRHGRSPSGSAEAPPQTKSIPDQ